MKAIILAAGMGTRLGDLTTATPKALMQVNGQTLLGRQIAHYRREGITDIHVVRGYLAEQVAPEGATLHENDDYATTGLLSSLFAAEPAMDGAFIFSYSDTVWRSQHAALLRDHLEANPDHIAVVVDRDWKAIYEGRDQHPLSEAECVAVDERGLVLRAGKTVTPEEAWGEVAGMGGVGAAVAARWRAAWHEMADHGEGLETPFGQKKTLRYAYVTDLMTHLASQGVPFSTVDVRGGWREIDTPQDLERAQEAIDW